MIFNKRGVSEKYLSPFNILLLVLLIGVIVLGIFLFSTTKTDVRIEETRNLNLKIQDCIISEGELNVNVLKNNFNLASECSLKEDFFSETGVFFARITISDVDSDEVIKTILLGNSDLEIQFSLKGKGFALCYKDDVYASDSEGKLLLVNFLTASNNDGRKA